MHEFVERIKNLGFNPTNILDIGAYRGFWGEWIHSVFPSSKVTMVEPIRYRDLSRFDDNENFSYINVLLDERPQVRDWYSGRDTGDSIFKETTLAYKNIGPVKKQSTTLDTEFENYFDAGPELIKIDTQGSEISILKGGQKILQNNEIIIMEMPFAGQYNEGAPQFSEYVSYMDHIGYAPLEIVQRHRLEEYEAGFFDLQVDFAFVKKGHEFLEKQQGVITRTDK